MSTWTEPDSIEILTLLEQPTERTRWLRAAQRVGVLLSVCQEPGELLSQLMAHPTDAVILPLGQREEESLLLCRAIRKRRLPRPVMIFLIDRGSSLVRADHDPAVFGADDVLPNAEPRDVLNRIHARLGLPVDVLIDASPLTRTRALPAQLPVPSRAATLEALQIKLAQALHGDYFTLLGVPMDASSEAILDAFTRLHERFDPASLPEVVAQKHGRELSALREALLDAWHALGDDASRGHYLDAIHQPDDLHTF